MCLDIEVEPDDEDDAETMDISAKEAYSALWSMLNDVAKKEGNPISINVVSTSRIQTSNIIPAKLDLRFVASAQYQHIGIELVFRDEAVYTQLLTQKSEFESFCGIKGLVWSDQSAKTKKIILDYSKDADIFEKAKYEKYILWFIKNGADLKEAIELFSEDMNIGKGIAPEIVDNPEMVFCKVKGILASAFYHGKNNGFEVLKQSSVKLSTKAYGSAQKKRDELVKSGVIRQVGDGKGEFAQDYRFSTPSQAADVILGSSNNGWLVWKNASGDCNDAIIAYGT